MASFGAPGTGKNAQAALGREGLIEKGKIWVRHGSNPTACLEPFLEAWYG